MQNGEFSHLGHRATDCRVCASNSKKELSGFRKKGALVLMISIRGIRGLRCFWGSSSGGLGFQGA